MGFFFETIVDSGLNAESVIVENEQVPQGERALRNNRSVECEASLEF